MLRSGVEIAQLAAPQRGDPEHRARGRGIRLGCLQGSAGSAGAATTTTCSVRAGVNTEASPQGNNDVRRKARVQAEGGNGIATEQARATGHRKWTQRRNAAAPQRLDLRSINSCEAQPVAGSLRLFLAASHPIRGAYAIAPPSRGHKICKRRTQKRST